MPARRPKPKSEPDPVVPGSHAKVAALLLADVERLRERAWSPYTVVLSTPHGAEQVLLDLPPLGEVRAVYTAIGTVVDRHFALLNHDAPAGGVDAATSMLGRLATALGVPAAD